MRRPGGFQRRLSARVGLILALSFRHQSVDRCSPVILTVLFINTGKIVDECQKSTLPCRAIALFRLPNIDQTETSGSLTQRQSDVKIVFWVLMLKEPHAISPFSPASRRSPEPFYIQCSFFMIGFKVRIFPTEYPFCSTAGFV